MQTITLGISGRETTRPENVILFSSRRTETMRSNAGLTDDAALRFHSLVRAEVVETVEAGAKV